MNEAPFAWGTDTVRRNTGIPFLVYEPRRRNAALLLDDARRWGGRVHLVRGSRRLTFDELGELVPKAATALGERGVRPGDRVMLLAFNSIEWVVGFWAVLAAGGVVVLANAWWSEAELQHSLGVVDPTRPATEAELRSFAAEQLAYFEVPTSWWIRVEPLPTNDVGKVQKRRLLADWPTG